jgi:hypothetical protein
MRLFNCTNTFIACVGISLLSACGVRNGSKGQDGVTNHACDSTIDNGSYNLEKEFIAPRVVLSETIRLTPPEADVRAGTYPGKTFSHQGTDYRFAFFGKKDSWTLDETDGVEPFPPVPGLAKGTFDVHCERDTCISKRVVLALRCPENDMLTAWMSERVKAFLEESPVTDMDDDVPPATIIPLCPSWTTMRTPSGSSSALFCFHYLHALEGLFGHRRCPEPDPEWDGGYWQPAEQAGLMLFDCWRDGDLYTFYEATWYDWMSFGDNTTESYRTVDARTGKELSLEDFVDEKDYERFAQILMKHLIKAAGNRAGALENYASDGSGVLPLLDGCGLVKEGLVVYFHPYTLGAGAYGQFNAVIPYGEMDFAKITRDFLPR